MKSNFFYSINFYIEERVKDLFLDYIESSSFFISIYYHPLFSFKKYWICQLITILTINIKSIIRHINSFRKNLNLNVFKIANKNFGDRKSLSLKKIIDRDWLNENKETFKPIKIARFTIYNKDYHILYLSSKLCLKINASDSFGTGYRVTTKSCIENICFLIQIKKFKRLLAYGSGTGILGIVVKKLIPNLKANFLDIGKNAIKMTKLNLLSNNLTNINSVFKVSNINKIFKKMKYYDLIISNIIFSELRELIKEFNYLIKRNGFLIISGILESQKLYLINLYRNFYFYSIKMCEENNWSTIIFKKVK